MRPEDILDAIAATLPNIERNTIDYAFDHNEYYFTDQLSKDNIKIDGGTSIERLVSFDTAGTAKYCGIDEVDEYKTKDTLHKISVPWALFTANCTWRKWEIVNNQKCPEGFLDLIQTKVDGMYIDLADMIEETMVATPNSETDSTKPYTLPYYLSFYTDTSGTVNSSSGFLGKAVKFGDGTYSYNRAGISSNTQPKWRNYCALYTAVNSAFVKTCREAMMKTNFRVPSILKSPLIKKRAQQMRAIAPYSVALDLMDLIDKKDDNHTSIGREVMGGMVVADGANVYMNKIPVVGLEILTDATCSPVYFYDLAQFVPFVHAGYWMDVTPPYCHTPTQHTVYSMAVDGAHNFLVRNLRKVGFVLHKAS